MISIWNQENLKECITPLWEDMTVYEHRGNGLIVDNILKPLKSGIKAGISSAASKAGKFIVFW